VDGNTKTAAERGNNGGNTICQLSDNSCAYRRKIIRLICNIMSFPLGA